MSLFCKQIESRRPSCVCGALWKDYFGSAVNGFETRLSDIDAVIVFSKEDMERLSQRNGLPCTPKLLKG